MSKVSIKYSDLDTASTAAASAASFLAGYSSAVSSNVTQRLDNYSGTHTGNITNARAQAQSKIDQLTTKRQAPMEKMSADISSFRDFAKTKDDAVATEITGIFNDFRTKYGLGTADPNFVWDALASILPESWVNALRRFSDFISSINQAFISFQEWIVSSVKDWYRYQGGKEMLETAMAVVEVAVAVVALVAVCLSGAGIVVLVAGIISSVITLLDGFSKLANRASSLGSMMSGDPVWSDRYSDRADNGEGITDMMRRSSDAQWVHNIATGVDIVNITCSVISLVDSCNSARKIVSNNGGLKAMVGNAYANFKSYVSHNFVAHLKSTFSMDHLRAIGRTYFDLSSDGVTRGHTPGYSAAMENLGLGKLMFGSDNLSKWGVKLNGDVKTTSGLVGLLNGSDRSFTNVIITVDKINSAIKIVNPVDFGSLDNIHINVSGYEKLLGSFSSVSMRTHKISSSSIGKFTKSIRSIFGDIGDLAKP